MKRLCIILIKCYQWTLSPYVGMYCRFTPTCSDYAIQAFKKYGFFKALYLMIARLLRCHPWHAGGHDPLP